MVLNYPELFVPQTWGIIPTRKQLRQHYSRVPEHVVVALEKYQYNERTGQADSRVDYCGWTVVGAELTVK